MQKRYDAFVTVWLFPSFIKKGDGNGVKSNMQPEDNHTPDISNDDIEDVVPLPIDELNLKTGDIQALIKHCQAIDSQLKTGLDDIQRYFILGNYDHPQRERLDLVKDKISRTDTNYHPYLLDDITVTGPQASDYKQFYLKFHATVNRTDVFTLVIEDNDGGHELETGEVPGEDLYILYRDYTDASIPDSDGAQDLHREKYDAMIAKLIALYDDANRVYTWTTKDELENEVDSLLNKVG